MSIAENVMGKTILAVLESDRFPVEVADRAARIAGLYGCNLHLMLSDPTVSFLRSRFMISADSQQIAANVRQAQREELDGIVASIAGYGLDTKTSIIQDRPASDAIVARALEMEPLIVVKGTTYHSTAERAVFTFNDWQLIRKLDAPLWLVKSREWQKKPVVIAAVDPMHPDEEDGLLTRAIIESARSIAQKTGGSMLVLHTFEVLEEVSEWTKFAVKPLRVPMDALRKKLKAEHRKKLDELAATHGIAADLIHMLPGRTREILPSFARDHEADLVVMGAVARSGLQRRVVGSTAEHVLDHIPCDILIERAR